MSTKEALESFAWANPDIHGTQILRRALPHIVEGAASPPEIDLALRLSLPHRYGGFALKKPLLNVRIPLSDATQALSGRQYVVADLFWPHYRLVMEYDSDSEHLNSEQAHRDATKRLALSTEGYSVIFVTTRMLKDPTEMAGVAKHAAGHLDIRLRIRSKDFERRQKELFELAQSVPWSKKTHMCITPSARDKHEREHAANKAES